jgi:hypothetical protein
VHLLLQGVLTGSALVGEVDCVRRLRDDAAVVHATGSVRMPGAPSCRGRRLSRQTIVAVRIDDGWRVAALHDGRVRPVTIPAPDSFPARASRASRVPPARCASGGRADVVVPGSADAEAEADVGAAASVAAGRPRQRATVAS